MVEMDEDFQLVDMTCRPKLIALEGAVENLHTLKQIETSIHESNHPYVKKHAEENLWKLSKEQERAVEEVEATYRDLVRCAVNAIKGGN